MVFYTRRSRAPTSKLVQDINEHLTRVDVCIDEHVREPGLIQRGVVKPTQLIILDEPERLPPTQPEYLRDRFDRRPLGLLLIGIPGLARRLEVYPSSTAGSVSCIAPLTDDELALVLTRHWKTP
jgi:DNA transposition AAA+ family ATPase